MDGIDGGPTGLLFTAMQPERVAALILANTSPAPAQTEPEWSDMY